MAGGASITPEAQAYIDSIAPEQRPLFDRMDGLIREAYPTVEILISYKMPTYKVGKRRLYVGVWKHGMSLYGWGPGEDAGFTERHPELSSGKGTIRISPSAAEQITDDELRAVARGGLGEPSV